MIDRPLIILAVLNLGWCALALVITYAALH